MYDDIVLNLVNCHCANITTRLDFFELVKASIQFLHSLLGNFSSLLVCSN